jgi:hypothetical protein
LVSGDLVRDVVSCGKVVSNRVAEDTVECVLFCNVFAVLAKYKAELALIVQL